MSVLRLLKLMFFALGCMAWFFIERRKALFKDYFAEKEGVKKFQILVFEQNHWLTPSEKCNRATFLFN